MFCHKAYSWTGTLSPRWARGGARRPLAILAHFWNGPKTDKICLKTVVGDCNFLRSNAKSAITDQNQPSDRLNAQRDALVCSNLHGCRQVEQSGQRRAFSMGRGGGGERERALFACTTAGSAIKRPSWTEDSDAAVVDLSLPNLGLTKVVTLSTSSE